MKEYKYANQSHLQIQLQVNVLQVYQTQRVMTHASHECKTTYYITTQWLEENNMLSVILLYIAQEMLLKGFFS